MRAMARQLEQASSQLLAARNAGNHAAYMAAKAVALHGQEIERREANQLLQRLDNLNAQGAVAGVDNKRQASDAESRNNITKQVVDATQRAERLSAARFTGQLDRLNAVNAMTRNAEAQDAATMLANTASIPAASSKSSASTHQSMFGSRTTPQPQEGAIPATLTGVERLINTRTSEESSAEIPYTSGPSNS